MKFIYLDQDEEITSIIDRLEQEEAEELNLVVPAGAQLWQNLINLKLLKREANRLSKALTLVTADELGEEMAQRVGLAVKKERDFPAELISQAEKENNFIETEEETEESREEGREEGREKQVEDLLKDLKTRGLLRPEPEEAQPSDGEEPGSDLGDSEGLPESELPVKLPESLKRRFETKNPQKKTKLQTLVDDLEAEKQAGNDGLFQLAASPFKKPKRKKVADITFSDLKLKKPIAQLKSKFFRTKPAKAKIKIFRPKEQAVLGEKSSLARKLIFIFIGLAVAAACLAAYLILPSAEIVITPKVEQVSMDLSVTGSKDITQFDSDANKIPVQLIKVEKTEKREFPATGQAQINEKASGIITVYNEYSSSPQTLVATTRFESSDGKLFRLIKTVIIPGAKIEQGEIIASSMETEVIADQPGRDYNIGPSEFTIPGFKGTPKYVGFYGRSKAPMTGGLVGIVKVVSSDDLKNTEETLSAELKEKARNALNEQIPADLKIVEKGINVEITKTSFSARQGDTVDNFNLEITAVARALLYNPQNLKEIIDLKLVSQTNEDKKPLSQTQDIVFKEVNIDWTTGKAILSLTIKEGLVWQIDINSIKRDLAGKEEVEVRRYFTTRPEIEKAKITLKPFWVKRVPQQDKRVKINIDPVLQNL